MYLNGAPCKLMAVICYQPQHYATVIPRGRRFCLVDDDRPVRPLKLPEIKTLLAAKHLTFLSRLLSHPNNQVRFADDAATHANTAANTHGALANAIRLDDTTRSTMSRPTAP